LIKKSNQNEYLFYRKTVYTKKIIDGPAYMVVKVLYSFQKTNIHFSGSNNLFL